MGSQMIQAWGSLWIDDQPSEGMGFIVSEKSIEVDPAKVKAIQEMPTVTPQNLPSSSWD